MAAVKVKIGQLAFDHADYDADGDVLYLHVGAPTEAEGEETPEGHVLRFEPGTQRIVGLTVINARWLLDRDGFVRVTVPETVAASAQIRRRQACAGGFQTRSEQRPPSCEGGFGPGWRRDCVAPEGVASRVGAGAPPRRPQRTSVWGSGTLASVEGGARRVIRPTR